MHRSDTNTGPADAWHANALLRRRQWWKLRHLLNVAVARRRESGQDM